MNVEKYVKKYQVNEIQVYVRYKNIKMEKIYDQLIKRRNELLFETLFIYNNNAKMILPFLDRKSI